MISARCCCTTSAVANCSRTLKGHSAQVYAFAVLQEPELAIVTAGLGGDAIVWERKLKGRRGYKLPAAKPGSGGWVLAAKLEGPRRTCGSSWTFRSIEKLPGCGVALFDDLGTETFIFERVDGAAAWKRIASLNTQRTDEISKGCGPHNSHVKCHSVLPSGELVMGCTNGLVQVWERCVEYQMWGHTPGVQVAQRMAWESTRPKHAHDVSNVMPSDGLDVVKHSG